MPFFVIFLIRKQIGEHIRATVDRGMQVLANWKLALGKSSGWITLDSSPATHFFTGAAMVAVAPITG